MVRAAPTEIGRRLEEFIREKGWTKREFAQLMGINPANVSKYIRGVLDAQHLVVPLISNGCDVTKLFFAEITTNPEPMLNPEFGNKTTLVSALKDVVLAPGVIKAMLKNHGNCAASWLQVSRQNGAGVFPILLPGDDVLLCTGLPIKDGDLVAAQVKKNGPLLRIVYFDRDTVMLRAINPTARPVAARRREVSLSKVILVRKK